MQNLIILLLMISGSVGVRYHTPDSCPSDHMNHDPDALLSETFVEDEFDCMDLCDDDIDCVAYNIQTADMFCELNDDTAGRYGEAIVNREDWTYWEKDLEDPENPNESCEDAPGRKQQEMLDEGTWVQVINRGGTRGWWGKDALDDKDRTYYVPDYHNREDLYEYPTQADFVSHTNYMLHYFYPRALGMGWIVYDRKFWYMEHNWRVVHAWDLNNGDWAGQVNTESTEGGHYGSYSSNCQRDAGHYASIDMEADETGLYMITGQPNQDCYLLINKIDHKNYRITRTWNVRGIRADHPGAIFMVDGIVYATDHYNHDPTFIMWQYNIRNNSVSTFRTRGENRVIDFSQPRGYGTTIHYNPRERRLYATRNTMHYYSEPIMRDIL